MGTKQLNHVDRMVLQGCIEKKLSLKDTIKRLKRNRSTIYRELIKNSQSKITSQSCGYCSLFHDCNLKKSKNCDLYIPIKCTKLIKFLYVCNGCKKSPTCRLEKRYYDYYYAIENVKRIRNIHHLTVDVSFEEMRRIDNVVTPGIKKGQSLHHVYVSNPSIQFISERTIRRYLYNNYLSVKAHNLPRYVRFEHAQSKKSKYGRIKTLKNIVGRTYKDYLEYIQEHPDLNIVQLDSVIGKANDSKALLTIYLPKTHFMFGKIIKKSSPADVLLALKSLQKTIGIDLWKKVFPIILTDNGPEFEQLPSIEIDDNGEIVTRVFYCDPYSSYQKGECERNHEFIRYIFAKGKSLENLNDGTANLMFSHINSYTRPSLNEKTPYELTKELFGIKFLELIGIHEISNNDVILKFDLFK